MFLSCFVIFFLLLANIGFGQLKWSKSLDVGFPVIAIEANNDVLYLCGGHNVASYAPSSGKMKQILHLSDVRISAVRLYSDHVLVAGTYDFDKGYFAAHRILDGTQKWSVDDLPDAVTSLDTAGEVAAIGDEAGTIRIVSLPDGSVKQEINSHSKVVTAVSMFDESLCASADWVGKIVLCSPQNGAIEFDFQQHRDHVVALVASTDSTTPRLYSASRDGTVRLWYPAQHRLVRFVQLQQPVTCLVDLGEGILLAATRNAEIHRIDMNKAKVVASYDSGMHYVSCMSNTEGSLVVSDGRKTIQIALAAEVQ